MALILGAKIIEWSTYTPMHHVLQRFPSRLSGSWPGFVSRLSTESVNVIFWHRGTPINLVRELFRVPRTAKDRCAAVQAGMVRHDKTTFACSYPYCISEPGGRTSKVYRCLKAPMSDSQVNSFRTTMFYLSGGAIVRWLLTSISLGACKAHDVP